MAGKVSVTICAGDEERRIRDCLDRVKWADEIIVVHSSHADRTEQIARKYTDKVFYHEWPGYMVPQRRAALGYASCDWVLAIDVDEHVTEELREEILRTISTEDAHDGYYLPRRNFFLGRWIRECGWYPDYQLRLFKRSKGSVTDRKVHEGYIVTGPVGYLKQDLLHYTHPTISEALSKINSMSTNEAWERVDRHRVKARDLLLHPLAAFLNQYFSRRGFREGAFGLMVSIIHAMTNAETYMKLWESQNVHRPPYTAKTS
jgi:glycosyltransferase involved in cell wall biosynthesis